MNEHSRGTQASLDITRRLEQFEQAWQSGTPPDIGQFLQDSSAEQWDAADRRRLLEELILVDLESRWRTAVEEATVLCDSPQQHKSPFPDRPRLEDYVQQVQELGPIDHLSLDLIQGEYRVRRRWGSPPNHAEYLERFASRREELSTALSAIDQELSPDADTQNTLSMDTRRARRAFESAMAPTPIGVLGDYQLLEEIARGGMGIVYKARQMKLNRIVALKMILTGQQADAQDIKRFLVEAEAAANLDHPRIVPIYEVGEHDGRHFFSMGYVEGQSLAKRLADGPLSPRDAASLLAKIAEAVHYAHQQGIVHRDLKPGNILLDKAGEPRITDFGLAKRAQGDSELTTTGQILGTPSYMPPEQALGRLTQIGPRSDVYALGAILYTLLTGQPPFRASSVAETLKQVVEQEPISPRQLNREVPRDLETICQKCLEKDSVRRYDSAQDVADECQRYLRDEPIHARPVSRPARLWRWCRRNPAVAGLAGATATTLVAGIVVSSILAAVANHNAGLANERAGQIQKQNTQLINANKLVEDKIAELVVANQREREATSLAQENATKAQQNATEAQQNATVAREQSQLALKSLEFVIFDIQSKLNNVPGAGDLKRSLLKTAIARLQEVSDQFASRSTIDKHSWEALNELGDLFLRIGSDSSQTSEVLETSEVVPAGPSPDADGTLTAARKVYQQSLDIAQKLAAADPSDAAVQLNLSTSYLKLGNVQLTSKQLTEALGSYRKGLEIREKLLAANPSDGLTQSNLSYVYAKIGVVQLQSGQVTEALASFEKFREINQKLLEANPSDAVAQRGVLTSYLLLGKGLLQSGQVTEALQSFQNELEISQKLAAADPSNTRAQRDLAVAYGMLGIVQLQSGQVTEALGFYQQALEISQKLAAADPSDLLFQRDLSLSYSKLGDVSLQAGQVTAALGSYQKLLAIRQKLAAADPSDAQAQRDLWVSHVKLGDMQLQSGQVTEALRSYENGLEISQKLAAADPSDAQAQRDLSVSYWKLGDVQLQSGQATEALGSYEKGLEISQQLAAADPSDAQAQRDLSVSYSKLGDVSLQARQVTEALGWYEKMFDLQQKLAAIDPSDAQAQRDLSLSYEKLGDVSRQAGQVTEALGHYQKAFEISQKLAAADPTDAQAQFDLYLSFAKTGVANQQAKRFEEAITWYEKALGVLQKLDQAQRLAPSQRQYVGVIQSQLQQCKLATTALGDWKTLLEQPADMLPALLDLRGQQFVQDGQVADAVQAVAKLRELGTATADQLYNAACVYSLCAAGIKAEKDELTAEQAAERQKHIADALVTLREAIKAGYKDFAHMQEDPDLDAIREQPGYKELVETLKAGKSGNAESHDGNKR